MKRTPKFTEESFKKFEKELRASPYDQKSFCKEKGVAHPTYLYYRRKFQSLTPNGFIEVQPFPKPESLNNLEITFSNGASIRLSGQTEIDANIEKLIKVVSC